MVNLIDIIRSCEDELKAGNTTKLEESVKIHAGLELNFNEFLSVLSYLESVNSNKKIEVLLAIVDSYTNSLEEPKAAFNSLKDKIYRESFGYEIPRELGVVLFGYD